MKVAFIFNSHKISGKLTKLFTGCYCYHVCFVDEEHMYDMHLIRRRRKWPHYPPEQVVMYDCNVTREYLEEKLTSDENFYGWKDYLLFSLRPIFHLFGLSTWNAKGIICSEMVNNDLVANGFDSPFEDEIPSPCALYQVARELGGLK